MLQEEQLRLPHATEKGKRSFPVQRGSTSKHHHPSAVNPQCTQRFRAEGVPLLCPNPKVMPRFSLCDVGEVRWLLSHRWTDARPILPDAANDSRNQGRVVSPSSLSLLYACVRLRQLREVHHNQLLPESAESLLTGAKRSKNRRVTCLLHITDVTPVSCSGYSLNTPCLRCVCCCCADSGARSVLFEALYALAEAFCLGQMPGAL